MFSQANLNNTKKSGHMEEIIENKNSKTKNLIYFIEIQKQENKKFKIPCSNEIIARKVLENFHRITSSNS